MNYIMIDHRFEAGQELLHVAVYRYNYVAVRDGRSHFK